MITIGLTGGIASGKSTVSAMLRELGAHVIDADRIGHQVYEPGTPGWDDVVARFGREIVAADGTIDRRKLGAIVFSDPANLQALNAIVHPRMRAMIQSELDELRRSGAEVVVVEAAILIEGGWADLVDEIWVTVVPETVAMERLISRNGLSADAALARIRSQMSNEERQTYAFRTIDTSASLDEVRWQVEELWSDLSARAAAGGIVR